MIRAVPDYYPAFHCIASRCGHSCCIGWEVDVSADALERYRRVEGPFGDRLRRSIAGEDCPHFVLGAEDTDTADTLCAGRGGAVSLFK